MIKLSFKNPYLIIVFTIVIAVLSAVLIPRMPVDILPQFKKSAMQVLTLYPGMPAEVVEKDITSRMERWTGQSPGIEKQLSKSLMGVSMAYTPNSGTQDAFVGVQLKESHKISTFVYASRLRDILTNEFPGVELSFNTGGLITAALNEGKPAPIDVQVIGNNLTKLRSVAERLRDTIALISTIRDARVLQRIDQPTKDIDIDRIKAAELGVKPVDAIKNIVSALNSSATFDKAFWIDERNGNHYYVGVTYPEYLINDESILENVNVNSATNEKGVAFRNFSKITESTNPVEINHYNLQREFNVYANIEGADIGSVSDEIQKRINAMTFPKGYKVQFQGEVAVIKSSFGDLSLGLGLAITLAFLIITPLFRSFRLPIIIILAFPFEIIGVVFLMWITNTNLNIQSLMGIIMVVGIAVSYGNILIDRINVLIKEGTEKTKAVITGASNRFRPVLMTASTTIFGLIPTAMSTSVGTEANIPLAIAVIGGTFMATLLTLYIIPILYMLIAKNEKTND